MCPLSDATRTTPCEHGEVMGLDSVELIMAVEKAFGIAISDEVASRLWTTRDLADHVESCVGAKAQAASSRPGLSRQEIEETITLILRSQLGIDEFGWDDRFVADLGVD